MRFSIMILGLVVASTCSNELGWGQTPQTPSAAAQDSKFWAGIITHRMDQDDRDTIFMVPKRELVNGVETIRYETQTTRPLTIRRVMLDSPASRAGMMPGDLLLKFNDQSLATHSDLVAAVQANGNQAAVLRYSRAGQEQHVELIPIQRPADYADRVRADRAAEAAEQAAGRGSPESDLVELPGNLSGLLSLAAKKQSAAQEPADATPVVPQASELQLPPGANFDRSTRLLIDKLDQFSKEWTDLLERQKQSLNELRGML